MQNWTIRKPQVASDRGIIACQHFEAAEAGAQVLRNGGNAWLMYLSGQDDLSYHSLGDDEEMGECSYLLANGQVDMYPEAWCVDVELCRQAFIAFFNTGGARPAAIAWEAD